ncbi:MAG: hypothetical protein CL916_07500 [Deltaproteobacteria bacterium]|nr:hypothetical protein [Deltaproteobacteria bacterium]
MNRIGGTGTFEVWERLGLNLLSVFFDLCTRNRINIQWSLFHGRSIYSSYLYVFFQFRKISSLPLPSKVKQEEASKYRRGKDTARIFQKGTLGQCIF